MDARTLLQTLEATIVWMPDAPPALSAGYASDLLSDVMANAPADSVLITVQAHLNAIAVCTLVGAHCLLACNSRPLPDDMVEAARREGIAVGVTAMNQFHTSWRVHTLLHGNGAQS